MTTTATHEDAMTAYRAAQAHYLRAGGAWQAADEKLWQEIGEPDSPEAWRQYDDARHALPEWRELREAEAAMHARIMALLPRRARRMPYRLWRDIFREGGGIDDPRALVAFLHAGQLRGVPGREAEYAAVGQAHIALWGEHHDGRGTAVPLFLTVSPLIVPVILALAILRTVASQAEHDPPPKPIAPPARQPMTPRAPVVALARVPSRTR